MNGDCLSCYSGYTLSNGNCVVQQQSISVQANTNEPYCVQFTSTFCTKCS